MIAKLLKFLLEDRLRVDKDGILRSTTDGRPMKLKGVMPLERQEFWRQRIAEARSK